MATTAPSKVHVHHLVGLPEPEALEQHLSDDERRVISAWETSRGKSTLTTLARQIRLEAALRINGGEAQRAIISPEFYRAYREYFNTEYIHVTVADLVAGLDDFFRVPVVLSKEDERTLLFDDLYFDRVTVMYLRRGNLLDFGIFHSGTVVGVDSPLMYLGRLTHCLERIPTSTEDMARVVEARGWINWLKRKRLIAEKPWLGVLA
ncbi:MAG TPA: hypothetical protein VJG64_01445 [Candidatus Paceibacterota bacterium]